MAKMIYDIQLYCLDHKTSAEVLLIPPVPINPANMPLTSLSKGADNDRTIMYALGLGIMAKRLHEHYKARHSEKGKGLRAVRMANAWDGMAAALMNPAGTGRLYTSVASHSSVGDRC